MVLAANWSIFTLFIHLTENEEMGHGEEFLRNHTYFFWTTHFLYLALFLSAFLPDYGAVCNEHQAYRKILKILF
jgi:hypothetical protein